MKEFGNTVKVLSMLFFNDWQASNLLKIGNTIQEHIDCFDGNPFTLPVDAPPEVPRLILKNQEDNKRLEISLEKAVLVIKDEIENKLELSNKIIKKFNKVVFDTFEWEVNRLARVTKLNTKFEKPSIQFIKDKYIKNGKLNQIHQLNLHWLKKKDFLDDKINYWIKLDTPEGTKEDEINISVDINLVKNEDRILNKEKCDEFFMKTNSLIEDNYNEILN